MQITMPSPRHPSEPAQALTGARHLKQAAACAALFFLASTAVAEAAGDGTMQTAQQFEATVLRTGDAYGNLDTDLKVADAGLAIGASFFVGCKDARYEATFVNWYGDVPEGAWLGLENGDGTLHLAINNGDADATSGCTTGDTLRIER